MRLEKPDEPPARKTAFVDGVHGLRAFAAVAVVIFHSGGSIGSDTYQGLESIAVVTRWLSSGVDLFFVISGFVISLPFFMGRKTNPPHYLANRLLRIYPISILTACIFLASGWLVHGRIPDSDELLSSILLLPNGTDPVPIVLWTLKQELLFYALFALVLFRPVFGLALLAGWGLASPLLPHDTAFMKWFFCERNVQFPLGILAAYLLLNRPPAQLMARALAAVASAAFIVVSCAYKTYDLDSGLVSILLGLSGAGIVLGTACAGLTVPRSLMFLGTASYSIYLIHFFFISLGNKVLLAAAPALPGALALFVLVAFATAAGCLYYLLFEKRFEAGRHRYLSWKAGARPMAAHP